MRSSEKQRCGTPSTEANFSLVSSSDSYLPELLQIMYIENYTYQDLIQYFTWTFTQLDSFDSFRQQVYQATKLYMKVALYSTPRKSPLPSRKTSITMTTTQKLFVSSTKPTRTSTKNTKRCSSFPMLSPTMTSPTKPSSPKNYSTDSSSKKSSKNTKSKYF